MIVFRRSKRIVHLGGENNTRKSLGQGKQKCCLLKPLPRERYFRLWWGCQVEGLLRGQGRQAVEGGALHRRLACILCVREQRGIDPPSLLPLSVQFIRPAQLGVKMLDLRRGKRGFQAERWHRLGQQVPCLFVEGDGIAHGYQPQGLIARGETPAEGWFRKPRSQGMVCQYRW